MKRRTIVLIGATGTFGQRLARILASIEGVELIVTSRSKTKAEELARSLRVLEPKIGIIGRSFDKAGDIRSQLASLSPFLVIDTSGPFQASGHALATAALDAGAHWIDIADARAYVLSFPAALETLAKGRALSAFVGASTSPALSMSAVAALSGGWRRIDTIEIAVRPGGATRYGTSTIAAVLSYAGLPIAGWMAGEASTVTGWGWPLRRDLPGLGPCYLSTVETADADLMPKHFNVAGHVIFRFGIQSALEHFGLATLGWIRQRVGSPSLLPLAPTLEKAHAGLCRFGGNSGGMLVDVTGLDHDARPARARWWLVAKDGDGPNVPVMAAAALTRKLLQGGVAPGAHIASGGLTLADILAEMRPFAITCGSSRELESIHSLFEKAVETPRYSTVAKAVRAFHAADAPPVWTGRATVEAGRGMLAKALSAGFGFPPSGHDIPVSVNVERGPEGETWTRNFGGACFSSRLAPAPGGLAERFGPFSILLALEVKDGAIRMPVSGWRLGRLPLPKVLAPKSDTREFEDADGRFHFDVRISAPIVGLIAHYRGWLVPKGQTRQQRAETPQAIRAA